MKPCEHKARAKYESTQKQVCIDCGFEMPLHVLKELGGWADLTMVLRYAHLSSEHLSGYAGNSKLGTNWLHSQKSPTSGNRHRA